MLCGISSPFGELFPIEGQIAHVLRTRAPCAIPYCYGTRTRLACVKHAASVRSEPGSNSRLKPVAWAKKMPRFAPRPAYPSKLLIARITQSIRARKLGWFRTDSGTSYRLSKSEAPLSSRKAKLQPKKYAKRSLECQQRISGIHRHSEGPEAVHLEDRRAAEGGGSAANSETSEAGDWTCSSVGR